MYLSDTSEEHFHRNQHLIHHGYPALPATDSRRAQRTIVVANNNYEGDFNVDYDTEDFGVRADGWPKRSLRAHPPAREAFKYSCKCHNWRRMEFQCLEMWCKHFYKLEALFVFVLTFGDFCYFFNFMLLLHLLSYITDEMKRKKRIGLWKVDFMVGWAICKTGLFPPSLRHSSVKLTIKLMHCAEGLKEIDPLPHH